MFLLSLCLSQNSDPMLLPWVQVDKGAIKFILSGANIMCPGLTSPGASLPVDLPEEANVVSTIMYIYIRTHVLYLSLQSSLPIYVP